MGRKMRWGALCLACAMPMIAWSQSSISSFRKDKVTLFSTPDAGSDKTEKSKDDFSFPIHVVKEQGEFVQIQVDGKTYWVSGLQARIDRKGGANPCLKGKTSVSPTIGVRGIGEGC